MGRLTWKNEQGSWGLRDVPWENMTAGVVLDERTRQRLYGALCKLRDYEDTGLEPAEVTEEREAHRWIPVEERLPDKRGRYLVTAESAGYRFCMLGHYNGPDWTEERSDQRFIAWMPLPEPYRQAKRSDGHADT